jgi:hypothetical protein
MGNCTLGFSVALKKEKSLSFIRHNLTALIASIILGLLILIAIVVLSGFPGPTQGTADKTNAPPEDVRRSR